MVSTSFRAVKKIENVGAQFDGVTVGAPTDFASFKSMHESR